MRKKDFWIGLIGNSLDHYDSALYIFLAPFLAPVFFPQLDTTTGLIILYSFKLVGFITRPIGSVIFGYLAIKKPVRKLLSFTLIGVSVSTFTIGIIPSYEQIGIIAPCLLLLTKAIQRIFAAGEHTLSSLFLLENITSQKHGRFSSYYLCSTMAGTLLASAAASCIAISSSPNIYWRIPFILGFVTGIFGMILRRNIHKELKSLDQPQETHKPIKFNKNKILYIIPIASFSYVTYTIPFIFLNNFIPLISNITQKELLLHNTILLLIDIALIPIFGYIIEKVNILIWMTIVSCLLGITIIPIFKILPYLNIYQITLAKLWIITLGVAFATPMVAMLYKTNTGKDKYLTTGLGYAVGSELIGKSCTAICFALWHYTHNIIAPAYYILFTSIITTLSLIMLARSPSHPDHTITKP